MSADATVDLTTEINRKTLPVISQKQKVVCKSGYGRYHSGVQLFTHSWLPENQSSIKAVLYLIHGLHGHCVVFHEMASMLVQYGIAAYSHDNYGHGRSSGTKVLPPNFSVYWQDAVDRIKEVSAIHPDVPVFAFGHSLGGLVIVDVILELKDLLSGCILMAPALGKNLNMSKLSALEFLAAPISKILPSFPVPTNLKASNFTSLKKKQIENIEDPLVYHGQPKLKHVVMITDAMEQVPAKAQLVTTPYLIVSGDQDVITPVGPMKAFHSAVPQSTDKSFKIYPGMRHGLYMEREDLRKELLEDLIAWILDHSDDSGKA